MKTFFQNLKASFSKYPKSWMYTIAAFLIGFFAVMGWHFADVAKTAFWWNFWIVLAVLCIITWVLVWVKLKGKQRKEREDKY
jgi:uncharacterized membrane protein YhhN